MDSISVENYIEFFGSQDGVFLKSNEVVFEIKKEVGEPIAFFDTNEVVFKLYDGTNFYALKCSDNAEKSSLNPIYTEEVYIKNNLSNNLFNKNVIEVIDKQGIMTEVEVVLGPWIDDVVFNNCTTRYIKQLHDVSSNAVYIKRRRKVKAAVLTALSMFLLMISGLKFMFPNEIYINPIDYKKLIAADSINTVAIALNKSSAKLVKDYALVHAPDASGRSIYIKENTNEVLSILIPEPVKADKPVVIVKPKVVKKVVPKQVKPVQLNKKSKEVNEEQIKEIHSKSKVDFKSTEF